MVVDRSTGDALRHVTLAELNLSRDNTSMEVVYHWSDRDHKRPPSDQELHACFEHGARTETALLGLAAALWRPTLGGSPISSTPRLQRHPMGNAYGAAVHWELGLARGESVNWQMLQVVVGFVDPYLMLPLAPQRFDLFMTPIRSGPMEPEIYDRGEEALAVIGTRVSESKTALAELISIVYREMVSTVELTPPVWESDCVTWLSGDAFRLQGVVRLR